MSAHKEKQEGDSLVSSKALGCQSVSPYSDISRSPDSSHPQTQKDPQKDPSIFFLFFTLSVPIIISRFTEQVLLFFDLIFLSRYQMGQGELLINASFSGGLMSFLIFSAFMVTVEYGNALASQYLGAREHKKCGAVGSQLVVLTICAYPLIVLLSFCVDDIFRFFGHDAQQLKLEIEYTRILLLYGGIPFVLRAGLSAFFTALGRTKLVMSASLIAMLINIPLNYSLIFGFGPFPELGLRGAAFATVLSTFIATILLLSVYLGHSLHKKYETRNIRWNWEISKKLIRYGVPNAIHELIGSIVFTMFIFFMYSYGPTVGAAVSIAMNWDGTFILPMIGAFDATMALVGRFIGAKDIEKSKKVVRVSFALMGSYAVIMSVLLLVYTPQLIQLFTPTMKNSSEVIETALIFVRLVSVYLIADAATLTFSATLSGAGDTRVPMIMSIILYVVFGGVLYWLVVVGSGEALQAWVLFIVFDVIMGIAFFIRYKMGVWKRIQMIE